MKIYAKKSDGLFIPVTCDSSGALNVAALNVAGESNTYRMPVSESLITMDGTAKTVSLANGVTKVMIFAISGSIYVSLFGTASETSSPIMVVSDAYAVIPVSGRSSISLIGANGAKVGIVQIM